jgi:hypothetical protein
VANVLADPELWIDSIGGPPASTWNGGAYAYSIGPETSNSYYLISDGGLPSGSQVNGTIVFDDVDHAGFFLNFINSSTSTVVDSVAIGNGASVPFEFTAPSTANYNLIIAQADNSQAAATIYGLDVAITPAGQPPVVGPNSITVEKDSAGNEVQSIVIAGPLDSVAVASPPSHGSVEVSGLTFLYTPEAGYSGADSFTYTGTNENGTSAPAVISITVVAESCDCEWMPYSSYDGFRAAVKWMLDADSSQVAANGLPPARSNAVLDILIRLGEQRVYRHLRASTMVTRETLSATDNAAPLPDCMLELKEAWASGRRPMEIVPLDRLRAQEPCGNGSGMPIYAAQDGETLRFWPPTNGDVEISYYRKPCALKNGEWSEQLTLARYPEVFLFAALIESAPFVGQDARLPMWEAKFQDALANAEDDERVRVYNGGPLKMRAR